jgi:hypothetical protein
MLKPFILLNLGLVMTLVLGGCKDNCIQSKSALLQQHQQIINVVKQHKYSRTAEEWNHYDAEMKRIIFECLPNQDSVLNLEERRIFWRENMGYIYQRYGLKLIKKFEATDRLIQSVKDSLAALNLSIANELDSLQQDWPVLVNLDPYTKERLVSYFEQDKRQMLIPASDSIIGDGE